MKRSTKNDLKVIETAIGLREGLIANTTMYVYGDYNEIVLPVANCIANNHNNYINMHTYHLSQQLRDIYGSCDNDDILCLAMLHTLIKSGDIKDFT